MEARCSCCANNWLLDCLRDESWQCWRFNRLILLEFVRSVSVKLTLLLLASFFCCRWHLLSRREILEFLSQLASLKGARGEFTPPFETSKVFLVLSSWRILSTSNENSLFREVGSCCPLRFSVKSISFGLLLKNSSDYKVTLTLFEGHPIHSSEFTFIMSFKWFPSLWCF